MDRRALLAAATALPLALTSARLWAAPAGADAKLLLVFLRGGYDAASLLVPLRSAYYAQARPTLAIPQPTGDDAPGTAAALDADWGLHPAMRGSLLPLWRAGQLAFVPFAGTTDLSRSHFETQDTIELGQPEGGRRDYGSGFLNRLAAALGGGSPVAFTDQLPLAMRGPLAVPNVSLADAARAGLDTRQARLIERMYEGTPLARQVGDGFESRERVREQMRPQAAPVGGTNGGAPAAGVNGGGDAREGSMADGSPPGRAMSGTTMTGGTGADAEMLASARRAIGTRGFEGQARLIGRLMRERHALGFVDVGGWDTHVGQGGATGTLATRFEELGRGLAAFAQEIGPAWSRTTVVVVSEFGRTFRENGNRGTDHGHGTAYWLLGGAVRGGRIAGEQVALERATLHQDRDWPVLNEYRALLGGLFGRLWGLDAASLARVFPDARPRDLGLV